MSNHNVGDLQVWWIPQVPMKAFEVAVNSGDPCHPVGSIPTTRKT